MLERVHEHIVAEIQQSSRTDTVFVLSAIAFNLVVLGVNSAIAGASEDGSFATSTILMVLLIATVAINVLALRGLMAGRSTRNKLLDGLIAMYHDQGVDKYYDPKLSSLYSSRYITFAAVVGILGLISVLVPLIQITG